MRVVLPLPAKPGSSPVSPRRRRRRESARRTAVRPQPFDIAAWMAYLANDTRKSGAFAIRAITDPPPASRTSAASPRLRATSRWPAGAWHSGHGRILDHQGPGRHGPAHPLRARPVRERRRREGGAEEIHQQAFACATTIPTSARIAAAPPNYLRRSSRYFVRRHAGGETLPDPAGGLLSKRAVRHLQPAACRHRTRGSLRQTGTMVGGHDPSRRNSGLGPVRRPADRRRCRRPAVKKHPAWRAVERRMRDASALRADASLAESSPGFQVLLSSLTVASFPTQARFARQFCCKAKSI